MSNGEGVDRAADRRTRVDHRVPRKLVIPYETRRGLQQAAEDQLVVKVRFGPLRGDRRATAALRMA
jgi:hypothetical protein